ncbi:MAG TPA: hypothetical protein VKT75_17055 [Acidobacteriaceae bacterium]|nr:hypothetical protein [Acidobacteriaceae bacterium]
MLQECQYAYPDGRTCRRIPKRGERLCRDHKNARRLPASEDAAYYRSLEIYDYHLRQLSPDQLAQELQLALIRLHPVLHGRLSRAHRLILSRALLAVATLTERQALNQLARRQPPAESAPHLKAECLRAGITRPES